MDKEYHIPEHLHPRIRGIEKLLDIFGTDYDFHDSEVEEIVIKRNRDVRLTIWSGWAPGSDKEYITEWTLHNCVEVDIPHSDPSMCWLGELDIDQEGDYLEVTLDNVDPVFYCSDIDVKVSEYHGKQGRVFFDMDNVLVDFASGISKLDEHTRAEYEGRLDEVPGIFSLMEPMPGAIKAVHDIAEMYDVYILSTAPWKNPSAWADKVAWVTKYLDDVLHKRLILSHHKDLLKGDFLIDDRSKHGADTFEGEWIPFESEKFPNWEAVVKYLKVNNNDN